MLNELLGLLDQADQGQRPVKLNYFAARVGVFLTHAQLDQKIIEELLRKEGVPESQWYWFEAGWWKSQRKQDLSQWTQVQRNSLRAWAEWMSGVQIIAWEEQDPLLNTWRYSYDAAGSLAGATVGVYQGNTVTYGHGDLVNSDASHLQALVLNGGTETYAYDHLNRRVVKDSALEQTVYLYDLAGNEIAEAAPDGTIKREWVYVGGQRLAMVVPAGGVNVCSLAGGAHGGEAFLGLMTLVFIGLGWRYRNRKFTVAGLTFLGGVVVLVLMPEARSQTPTEYIYYYHNDHLGTPRVVTDDQMNIVWDVDYKPFGEVANYVVNNVNQPFRFPGQYADSLSGLSYNWNRYYMPEVGRYNRIDMMGYPRFIYSYSFDNPIRYRDPKGNEVAIPLPPPPPITLVPPLPPTSPAAGVPGFFGGIFLPASAFFLTLMWPSPIGEEPPPPPGKCQNTGFIASVQNPSTRYCFYKCPRSGWAMYKEENCAECPELYDLSL